MAWGDYRNPDTAPDIYAQRINADGTIAPGWPVDGVPVIIAPYSQLLWRAASDGAGGAFFAWEDQYPTHPLNIQHLTAAGSLAAGWPVNGLLISIADGERRPLGIIADGAGGALVVWSDTRSGANGTYAQRITADGAVAPGWVPGGWLVVPGRYNSGAVSDGVGGAYLLIDVPSLVAPPYSAELWLQRITGSGMLAPGWPTAGVLVCSAPNIRVGQRMAPDGLGGALISWEDYRDPSYSADLYVMRVLPDATLAPGWTPNGLRLTSLPTYETYSDIAADGLGGAYFSWISTENTGERVMVQHLTATGGVAPGWPAGGVSATTNLSQHYAQITADGVGGAIVAWDNGSPAAIYAQRFGPAGPVAVSVSLVSAEAASDLVTLAWHEAGERAPATLYRSTGSGEWSAIARLDPDGEGMLRYVDREVAPGTRYGYRLGIIGNRSVTPTLPLGGFVRQDAPHAIIDGGIEKLMGEVSVEIPDVSQLALRGVSPNPAVRDLNVSFSLAGDAPATLDLIDIAGRRVKSEEVGSLGAGNHVLNVNRDGLLAAGVYLVRLAQGMRTATARAIVVR